MRPHLTPLLTVVALAAVPLGLATAQTVTPTHSTEMPLVLSPFTGSVVFGTLVGPTPGENVWGTELHLRWTTNSEQPASDFGLHLSTNDLAQGPSGELELTGADLGWSGLGTFDAVVSTDLFDGTLISGLPGFPSTFDLVMEKAGGGGLWGVLDPVATMIVYHHGPRMEADVPGVSLSAGGTQTLDLNAGPTVGPGTIYLVAGSASGTTPFGYQGISIPLVPDAWSIFTAQAANLGPFVNTLGFLDEQGRATAAIAVPAATDGSLAGITLHHAMLGFDPGTLDLTMASNAVDLLLQP